MEPDHAWRCLHRCDEFSEALMVRTSIAAMEFDVRLVDGAGAEVPLGEQTTEGRAPFEVLVRREVWSDLADVLPELIAEQREFDASMEQRDARVSRTHRWLLLVLIAIVSILATFGYIEL